MISFCNISSSLLICMLFVAVCRCQNEEKDKIIDDIIKYSKVEAHLMIDVLTSKALESKNMKKLNFANEANCISELGGNDINVLNNIRNIQKKLILCTYANIAFKMVEQFQIAFNQLATTLASSQFSMLQSIGQLVEISKILWRKAISAVHSIGVKLDQWFWQILIYTNTITQVTTKIYSGISETASNETLMNRILYVQKLLKERLLNVSNECKQLLPEDFGNLKINNDKFLYPTEIKNPTKKTCPLNINKPTCDSHFEYVNLFEKLLFRNNSKNSLVYTKHEMFDPEKWLITLPVLEKMLVKGAMVNINWQNVQIDLNYYVKCISNDDWILNYPNVYFDAVSNVLNAVRQATMQIIKQNWITCREYWRKIEHIAETLEEKFEKYSKNCTGIRNSIGIIIDKMALQSNEVLSKLHKLLNMKFTMYIDFNIAINYINEAFNNEELYLIFNDKLSPIPHYTEYFNENLRNLSDYANSFPTIHEYNEIFKLFKSSFYKSENN